MGSYTARRDRRQRGGAYWVAYRTAAGQQHKVYLGKAEDLTPERLDAAAAALTGRVAAGIAGDAPSVAGAPPGRMDKGTAGLPWRPSCSCPGPAPTWSRGPGCSPVRDPDWLDAVPSGRPAVIVADGLMGFLTQDKLVSLWNRLIGHFPGGELVFNSYTRFAIWIARHARGTKSVADQVKFPGMDDPRTPERWNPKLHLVREILARLRDLGATLLLVERLT